MLKFLTHKLRTHSLNEDSVSQKVEERDSGTESDDEADNPDNSEICTDVAMKWNYSTDISMSGGGGGGESCACPVPARALTCPTGPASDDQLYDHHSSEEELEVINAVGAGGTVTGRDGSAPPARARRRPAVSPPPPAMGKRKYTHPAESDDDDTKVETPVRFRTSPPLEALKPWRPTAHCACPVSEPSPVSSHSDSLLGSDSEGRLSPRQPALWRRRRALPAVPARRQRPQLDFDKMQQLKMVSGGGGGGASAGGGGVRSWRAVGGAAGELSVFCW